MPRSSDGAFSLKDLCAVKTHLNDPDDECDPAVLAQTLVPAVQAGLLVEHAEGSPADYAFTHGHVREFAAASLTAARRRSIHLAIVDLITAEGDPPPASLSLLAHHAVAAGDTERARAVHARRGAGRARGPRGRGGHPPRRQHAARRLAAAGSRRR